MKESFAISKISAGALILIAAIGLVFFICYGFSPDVRAQAVQSDLPTAQNPIVARIFDSHDQSTDIEPLIVVSNGQLHVGVPEPKSSFRPGRYKLELWIWQNGVIYFTENDFSWGVLAVNFNKSIYDLGDKAKIGFGVLSDDGRTICDAMIDMDVTSPSGNVSHFSTQDRTIRHGASCGPGTVTNDPDYSASLAANEVGTYNVSVVATTANGTRQISDGFAVQDPPLFDVERFAPTRIYPPVSYGVSAVIKANADFSGNITETVPSSFIVTSPGADVTADTDVQTISWPVNIKKGDAVTLSYSFKAPDVSPELYKLGPIQIGNWEEARQWQIAADSISNTVIFITTTASTTWTVPKDWNSASNTIEVIGGGGGGSHGTSTTTFGAGGGGGAYASVTGTALTASTTVNIQIGIGGLGASSTKSVSGTATWFMGSGAGVPCSTASALVCADFGGAGVSSTAGYIGGTGGTAGNSSGTVKFAGGTGANGSSTSGGAGGAGGPHGAGKTATGGNGAAGDNGSGGAGGTKGTNGGTGGIATEWTSSPGGANAGAGGGGGGASGNGTGGGGGNYGAGGGGAERTTNAGGTGTNGIIVITYTPTTVTLADGTQPAGVTIGPGGSATTSSVFTFQTNNGTSSITLATTTVSTSTGVYQIQITDTSSVPVVYGSSTNPTTSTVSISLSGMNVSTTLTTFRIMIVPLNATSMPAVPGGTYVVTSTLAAWTDSKSLDKAGANTTSSPVTIDNQSPGNVTGSVGSIGDTQITLNWTNPGDSDFATTTVLRATSSISVVPTEGASYAVGNTINATTTVACVVASSTSSCTDTGLTNGTVYYYKIFTADNYLNYSAGVVPGGNPFTPSPLSISNVLLNHGNAIILTPNATTSFDINYRVSDSSGCASVTQTTSTAFRGGVSSTCAVANPTTSSLNCYIYVTHTTSTCAANSFNVTDTVQVYDFAQSSGNASSSFPTDHWYAYASAIDAGSSIGTATSGAVDVNVLLALNITTSTINYGTVPASSTTGAVDVTTTIQNVGNASQTLQISGTALVNGANLITTSSQHYATSSFTYGGAEQLLNGAAQAVAGFLLPAASSTSAVQNNIFWGIRVPSGATTGTYSGTTVVTAIWSQ